MKITLAISAFLVLFVFNGTPSAHANSLREQCNSISDSPGDASTLATEKISRILCQLSKEAGQNLQEVSFEKGKCGAPTKQGDNVACPLDVATEICRWFGMTVPISMIIERGIGGSPTTIKTVRTNYYPDRETIFCLYNPQN